MKEHGITGDRSAEEIVGEIKKRTLLSKKDCNQQLERQIIAKLYGRPVRNAWIREIKGRGNGGKMDIFEDLCKEDYRLK